MITWTQKELDSAYKRYLSADKATRRETMYTIERDEAERKADDLFREWKAMLNDNK